MSYRGQNLSLYRGEELLSAFKCSPPPLERRSIARFALAVSSVSEIACMAAFEGNHCPNQRNRQNRCGNGNQQPSVGKTEQPPNPKVIEGKDEEGAENAEKYVSDGMLRVRLLFLMPLKRMIVLGVIMVGIIVIGMGVIAVIIVSIATIVVSVCLYVVHINLLSAQIQAA